jgi:hypothetical protein
VFGFSHLIPKSYGPAAHQFFLGRLYTVDICTAKEKLAVDK